MVLIGSNWAHPTPPRLHFWYVGEGGGGGGGSVMTNDIGSKLALHSPKTTSVTMAPVGGGVFGESEYG